VFILAVGSLAGFIASGFSDGDDVGDPVARVTPGAEIARLETQVAGNPSDIDSMVVLADILANSGRVGDAIPWYERAVEQRPDDARLRLAFGRALLRSGSLFDAQLQLTRAVELDPEDAIAAYYLAQLYDAQGGEKTQDARTWYQRSIDLDPESFVAGQALQRLAELDAAGTPTAPASPTT
jgi:cytochrome c-type biogenesis protein CcmH/NrfG